MNRQAVNRLGVALLDVLAADGIPESYAVLAGERAGLDWATAREGIALYVAGGLLRRQDERLLPGPAWDRCKAALAHYRQQLARAGA